MVGEKLGKLMKNLYINKNENITLGELLELRKTGKSGQAKFKRGSRKPTINTNYATKFLEYGDIDYEAAKVLFDIKDREYDFMNQAAFFCAQATEKYLKAFLFWNAYKHYPGLSGAQVLEKFKNKLRHALERILEECIKDRQEFSNFETQIKVINKYSLLKYPDVEDEIIYSDEGLSINSDMSKDVKAIGDFVKGIINKT